MKRTYQSTIKSRGCEETPACEITYTETVDFDARTVTTVVTGWERYGQDREPVNQRSVSRFADDFRGTPETVDEARRSSGWTLIHVSEK